jgi:tetratricopeptide (TPR) repeat protein
VLLAAEVVWRVAVPLSEGERQSADFIARSRLYLQPCARRDTHAGRETIVGLNPLNTGGGFVYPLAKEPDTLRLAFVGESTSVMLGGTMFNLVEGAGGGRPVEVLNCGDSGSTLEHVERRADEVLGYGPDALIVAFGHNFVMTGFPTDERALRLRSWLVRSRLIGGLARVFAPRSSQQAPAEKADRVARLADWIDRLAGEARHRAVPLILTTVTPNYWFPPVATDEAVYDPGLLAAVLAHARGDRAAAIERLSDLAEGSGEAYWHWTLGRYLADIEATDRAEHELERAVDTAEIDVDRATSAVNDTIRAAAQRHAVVLRDSERAMRAIADRVLPGWDAMRDHCHLQPRYLVSEAEALLALAVEAAGGATPATRAPGPMDESVEYVLTGLAQVQDDLVGARRRRYQEALEDFVAHWLGVAPQRTLAAIDAFVAGSVFSNLSPEGRAGALARIAAGCLRAGRSQEGRALNERARASGAAQAWIDLGLLHASEGDDRSAVEAFARALDLEPARADAAFYLEHLSEKGR